jgi:hypothetical protein
VIRRRFEERFSAERMARDYVTLYSELLHTSRLDPVLTSAVPALTAANAA